MKPTTTYCIRVLSGPLAGAVYTLVDVLQVGRGPSCDIQIVSRGVSRAHATINVTDDGVFVVDMLSTNGTWIRGTRVHRQKIAVGTRIRIADSDLLLDAFEPDDAGGGPPMDRIMDTRATKVTQPLGLAGTLGTSVLAPNTEPPPPGLMQILTDIVLYRTLRLKVVRGDPCTPELRARYAELHEQLNDTTGAAPTPRTFHGELRGVVSFADSRTEKLDVVVLSLAVDAVTIGEVWRATEVDLPCWLSLPLLGNKGLRAVMLTGRVAWSREDVVGLILSGAPSWATRRSQSAATSRGTTDELPKVEDTEDD